MRQFIRVKKKINERARINCYEIFIFKYKNIKAYKYHQNLSESTKN